MHEMSICRTNADIVTRHAGRGRVSTIHLQVGQLRQVVPDTLTYCWSMVSADTPLAGSALAVQSIPGRISCRACGAANEIGRDPVFTCRSCGSADVQVVAGEEFLITSLELAEA